MDVKYVTTEQIGNSESTLPIVTPDLEELDEPKNEIPLKSVTSEVKLDQQNKVLEVLVNKSSHACNINPIKETDGQELEFPQDDNELAEIPQCDIQDAIANRKTQQCCQVCVAPVQTKNKSNRYVIFLIKKSISFW